MAQSDPVATTRPAVAEPFNPAEAVKTRKPFNGFTKKLEIVGEIPGYILYWINDDGNRVPTAVNYGYQFVTHEEIGVTDKVAPVNQDLGERVSRIVGKMADGVTPLRAYLMKLPREFAEQDQQARDERPRAIETAIRGLKGGVAGVDVAQDGTTYNPQATVIKTTDREVGANPTSLSGMQTRRTKTM